MTGIVRNFKLTKQLKSIQIIIQQMPPKLSNSARSRSGFSRSRTSQLKGLVTNSQNALSSQATIYTDHTQRNKSSQQDIDDFQDIISEQIDTLFITEEEEKKIQHILEFARKGKINAGNAFDIPVKVIDPQNSQRSNMRFWKFASELLFASMSIYDKRVENVYQNTNRMFDSLLRLQSNPDKKSEKEMTEEEIQEQSRNQRGELIRMNIEQLGKNKALDRFEIEVENCEQPSKINIKNVQNQFIQDPLFSKRLQTFDSNSLKCLFLNVFQCGNNLQITFFNAIPGDVEKQQEKMEDTQQLFKFPQFIKSELNKLNFLAQNQSGFQNISEFKRKNLGSTAAGDNTLNSAIDFGRNLKQAFNDIFQKDNLDITSRNQVTDDSQFNFNYVTGDNLPSFNEEIHQDAQTHTVVSSQNHPVSERVHNEFYFDSSILEDDTDSISQNYTLMTPWELELRGIKLQKKPRKQGERQKRNKREVIPEDITFDPFVKEKKIQILKSNKIDTGSPKRMPYGDKFLVQKNMEPYMQYRKKIKKSIGHRNYQQKSAVSGKKKFWDEDQNDNYQQKIQEDEHIDHDNDIFENGETGATNLETNFIGEGISTQGMLNYKMFGLRNIREIKESIYQIILSKQSVRISELNFGISPQSMLIIFLHLVNEKQLQIRSIDDQFDATLGLRENY